ncbi:hypothetical protein [Leptospira jelokensis]|uniref:Uncharacterized protein n=1 Tax=Leptospira jelokensis TaxID=2484931 RepID=A0A4Z0ZVU9_9LEPT|nr:hypothetical protein [Leptospira jelokensis]TGL57779.1 hypothetical protein EHQ62_17650 [Leptospira jelokensis]
MIKKIVYGTLFLLFVCKPMDQERKDNLIQDDWHTGPEREEIEPGYIYVRDQSGEYTFNRRGMDPREIARKEAILGAKYLRDIIEEKNFALLIEDSLPIYNSVGSKLGGLNKYENSDEIKERWLKIYNQSKKDPFCNFDELFKGKIISIEISPYRTRKPDVFYSEKYKKEYIFYRPDYLFTIEKLDQKKEKIIMGISFSNQDSIKTYFLEKYFDHCPVPNLQAEDDPYLPEIDL